MLADVDARRGRLDRGLKRPRMLGSGASGLRSQVSSWLGPPHWKIRMHDRARPNPDAMPGTSAPARPRNSSGSARPNEPRTPARSA